MNLRRQPSFTLIQASQNNPGLAKLMSIQRDSRERLNAIDTLIPAALRPNVQCGPIEEDVWCLLLKDNTTAAKLRQLLPDFQARLKERHLEVKSIRLKVSRPNKP